MIVEIPSHKICPRCKEDKDASDYRRDSHRADGLTFYCSLCMRTYKRSGPPKRNLAEYTKVCDNCKRERIGTMFAYASTSDGLKDTCRTCSSWKQSKTHPSLAQVLAFEERLNAIVRDATITLMSRYKNTAPVVLADHRGEFEQMIWVKMTADGLDKLWKAPVWLHNTSKI